MDENRVHEEKVQVIAFLIKDFLSPLQVRSAINEVQCSKVAGTAKILHKLVQNALRTSAYRKIRFSNKTIHEKVITVNGAVDLLTAVGFAYDESDGEKSLIFVPDSDNVALANFFCITLEEDLDKFQQKEKDSKKNKKVVSSKADNEGNEFLSEKERRERRTKALRAKKAEKKARELAILRWNEDKSNRIEAEKRKQNATKKAALGAGRGRDQSLSSGKIRKLSTSGEKTLDPPLPHSSNPDELLRSLRAEAQAEWQKKHGMDIDIKNDTVIKEPTIPVVNHDQHEDTSPQKPVVKPEAQVTFNSHKLPVDFKEQNLSPSWEECLENITRCGPSHKIRDTSAFYTASEKGYVTSSNSPKCFRKLFAELDELKSSLPSDKECSAWLRFDEETPQYLRALLTAPLPGPSPYSGGVFAFDIFIPDDYPMVSPSVKIVTTGQGTVRFGPNLYADGKVCLSLLGTWQGPKWDPKRSSLYQVLVSIQSLVLGVEHPYYLEPSYGGWEAKVKEGDFVTIGHTLKGDAVREEMSLPSEVWEYEDRVRIGTIRFAMIEPLLLASGKEQSEMKPSVAILLPFEDVIKAHFYHNGNVILTSIKGWLEAYRPSSLYAQNESQSSNQIQPLFASMSTDDPSSNLPSTLLHTLQELFLKLESSMSQVCRPSFSENSKKTAVVGDDSVTDASAVGKPKAGDGEPKKSEIDRLQEQMKEAAQKNNFILAGQLQSEIKKIDVYESQVKDLEAKVKEAAERGDYISAGKYQIELKALQKTHDDTKSSILNSFGSQEKDDNQIMHPVGYNQLEDESHFAIDEEVDDSDDSENSGSDNEYSGYGVNSYGRWGSGQQLGQKSDNQKKESFKKLADISSVPTNSKMQEDQQTSRLPIVNPCQLRIRLPESGNKSVLEIFDSNEKLSVLYRCLKNCVSKLPTSSRSISPRLMQLQGFTNNEGKQAVGVYGGAFANPYSEYGFTLLSVHPKREFSLEIHGSMSLKDLGLTPSATLTVMRTDERGQVKRGILESKLGEANGDAMDVEGLGYEALQELGERIGIAAPGDGTWKGIDESTLETISTVISPNDYLSQKLDQDTKKESKCPICLGEFDTTDATLLQLKNCGHTFHSACLMTWLNTKTNCPICKGSLS